MSILSTEFLIGAAHAMVFAIFALAGIGKLLACTGAVRSLCGKAAVDFAFAGLALLPWSMGQLLCGALALGIGLGGWAIERLRRNPVCRCFGLLNRALHGYRNWFRASLFVGGALLVAATADGRGGYAGAALWSGAACVLAAMLLLVTAAFGIAQGDKKPPKGARVLVPEPPPDCALEPGLHMGKTAEGRPVTLGELRRGDAPIAILLALPGCAECETVKAEFLPLRPNLPFPFLVVERGRGGAGPWHLADAGGELARRLRINGYPALVVLDPLGLKVAAPLAFGADDIRKRLMHLILNNLAQGLPAVRDGVVSVKVDS